MSQSWNEQMNESAKDTWLSQPIQVKKHILFENRLPSELAEKSWEELSPEQQKKIDHYLHS